VNKKNEFKLGLYANWKSGYRKILRNTQVFDAEFDVLTKNWLGGVLDDLTTIWTA
jgi:hypothetical protein